MKLISFLIAMLVSLVGLGQTSNKKVSSFFSFQLNRTISDRTITNNAGGAGFGLHTNVNTNTYIYPVFELNADLFAGTKEMYLTNDGRPIYAKSEVFGIHAGASLKPVKRLFVAATVGTNFYNNKVHFGIRPSIGYFPWKSEKVFGKLSFTNVLQRDDISNEAFQYMSFALALKLL